MVQLTRHQIGASLLAALRHHGLGVRDLFEGRQEPATWFFRCLAYDQSELDIMESGAIHTLHAPSALIELAVDEVALACANIGPEGMMSYLTGPEEDLPEDVVPGLSVEQDPLMPGEDVSFHPAAILAYLNVDVAPPALWLDERHSDSSANERMALRLAEMAQEVGIEADAVEVHIEGALDASGNWSEAATEVRPAGVSVHFTVDVPLAGLDERTLAQKFDFAASVASGALERMRPIFDRPR
jgi:hypothetical protein